MDVRELLARFEAGVRYACGCEERGLHPAVVRGLETGAVPASSLLRCPQHGARLVDAEAEAQVSALEQAIAERAVTAAADAVVASADTQVHAAS